MVTLRHELSVLLKRWHDDCYAEPLILRFDQSQHDLLQFFASESRFVVTAHHHVARLASYTAEVSAAAFRASSFLATTRLLLAHPAKLTEAYFFAARELHRRQQWQPQAVARGAYVKLVRHDA